MNTTTRRCLFLLSILLVVWSQFTLVPVAYADDCGRYLQNPTNLLKVPQSLIEDCMRTGYSQAIITAIVASIAGGAVAAAVAKALAKGFVELDPDAVGFDPDPAEAEKRTREGYVWDRENQRWVRPPPPEEIKDSPITRTLDRKQVPVECLRYYDAYAKLQGEVLQQMPAKSRAAENFYQRALTQYLRNFMALTIQLGLGLAPVVGTGAGMGVQVAKTLITKHVHIHHKIMDALIEAGRTGADIKGKKIFSVQSPAEAAAAFKGSFDTLQHAIREWEAVQQTYENKIKELKALKAQLDDCMKKGYTP